MVTDSTGVTKYVHDDDNRRQNGRLGCRNVRIPLSMSGGDSITLRKAVKNTIARWNAAITKK